MSCPALTVGCTATTAYPATKKHDDSPRRHARSPCRGPTSHWTDWYGRNGQHVCKIPVSSRLEKVRIFWVCSVPLQADRTRRIYVCDLPSKYDTLKEAYKSKRMTCSNHGSKLMCSQKTTLPFMCFETDTVYRVSPTGSCIPWKPNTSSEL